MAIVATEFASAGFPPVLEIVRLLVGSTIIPYDTSKGPAKSAIGNEKTVVAVGGNKFRCSGGGDESDIEKRKDVVEVDRVAGLPGNSSVGLGSAQQ